MKNLLAAFAFATLLSSCASTGNQAGVCANEHEHPDHLHSAKCAHGTVWHGDHIDYKHDQHIDCPHFGHYDVRQPAAEVK